MGVVRILLPLPRAAAKWAPEKGGPLLGAALSYCVTPSWAGLPPPSPARRLAWAEEAVAAYRAAADTAGLSRALALRAHALLLSGRFEEACGAVDEAVAVWGAGAGGDAGEAVAVRGARDRTTPDEAAAAGAGAGAGADEVTAAGAATGHATVAGTAADDAAAAGAGLGGVSAVPDVCAGAAVGGGGAVSPAVAAFLGDVRAQALAGVGRAEDALPVARASVAAYRRLPAPDRRDRALGSLPGALRTYGMLLATTGRREESVAVYEECAALLAAMSLRELAHVERVRPQVLAELVGVLRASGRHEDALGVGPEAREALRGPLAWTVPETVLPLRVRLLVDLARCHTATGDPAEARACAQAAVAEARKPHGAGELTSALDCLADVLGELGQTDKESLARRELAELRDT
ncbi:tetratricopeptide repeat protein [Streptomyces sp. 351MFTsu5.1]|uniref:tetratricopeptide repeat protein n=1 Tax=Streptomyces sp. 351MFTsu5.1 TaxID=1172180 RepID=UPI0003A78E3D|nr:tetratricopeptide repeat protein [Streptomyces sp. 351MFTsu5.1]